MNKIQRAIILAAGRGERMKPLTDTVPKPLIPINGKRIIDTIIQSLRRNGITEIYVVTGYRKQQFEMLPAEYPGLVLIDNPYYEKSNNISSLYVAREHLENAVIVEGDQIVYQEKIFFPEFEQSCYHVTYSKDWTKEWLLTVCGGQITGCCKKGGKGGWELHGISSWTAEDGRKLRHHLEIEFERKKNRDIFWDEVALFCHPKDYRLGIWKMKKEDVIEVDSLEELAALDETYEGYAEKSRIKKLQAVQLQELKDFAKFCDRHGIDYFLDAGTLLGAVRHKGFIPWDDDVDVCMDVRNYRKFLRLSHLYPSDYFVQNYRNDQTMTKKWTKIRKNNTTITPKEEPLEATHAGACLDVFVMAGVSGNRPGKLLQKAADEYLCNYLKRRTKKKFSRGIPTLELMAAKLAEWVLWHPFGKARLLRNTYYSPGETGEVCIPAACFRADKKNKMKFEDSWFSVPRHYKYVLQAYYGDWKKLPPNEERTGHGSLFIDLEHGYEYYLGKGLPL